MALELTRLYPDDPEVLYHTRPPVRELRLPADDEALARVAPDVACGCTRRRARRTRARATTTRRSREYRAGAGARRRGGPGSTSASAACCSRGAAPGNGDVAAEARGGGGGVRGRSCGSTPPTRTPPTSSERCSARPGELDDATRLFERAVAAYPDFEEAWSARTCAARRGRPRQHAPPAPGRCRESSQRGRVLPAGAGSSGARSAGRAAGGAGRVHALRDDKARQREAAALKPDRAGVTPQVIDAAGAPPETSGLFSRRLHGRAQERHELGRTEHYRRAASHSASSCRWSHSARPCPTRNKRLRGAEPPA